MARKYRETQHRRRPQQDPDERKHARLIKELREELRQTRRSEELSQPRLDLKQAQPCSTAVEQ